MKYFLIAGEASGDLHAAHLMRALRKQEPAAQFQCYGGDEMQAAGGVLLRHYRTLAYMGFIPVLLHARTILRGLKECKEHIRTWRPDVVILVDYAGFNLKIARFVHEQRLAPVHYYISPKIWAWKERRIHEIRRYVDRMLCILPFEPQWFRERHGYTAEYVGNPTLDEVAAFLEQVPAVERQNQIALLPGSRRQEIRDNLRRMLLAVAPRLDAQTQAVICQAPGMEASFYENILTALPASLRQQVRLIQGETYDLVRRSRLALVVSGTATLETALLGTPQIVCYYAALGPIVLWLKRHVLRVPFISLVNLIAGREVVPELIASEMCVPRLQQHIAALWDETDARRAQLEGYAHLRAALGEPGAPERAAKAILRA